MVLGSIRAWSVGDRAGRQPVRSHARRAPGIGCPRMTVSSDAGVAHERLPGTPQNRLRGTIASHSLIEFEVPEPFRPAGLGAALRSRLFQAGASDTATPAEPAARLRRPRCQRARRPRQPDPAAAVVRLHQGAVPGGDAGVRRARLPRWSHWPRSISGCRPARTSWTSRPTAGLDQGRDACSRAVDPHRCLVESYQTRLVELTINGGGIQVPATVEYRCDDNSKPVTAVFYNDITDAAVVAGGIRPSCSRCRSQGHNNGGRWGAKVSTCAPTTTRQRWSSTAPPAVPDRQGMTIPPRRSTHAAVPHFVLPVATSVVTKHRGSG